MKNQLFILFLLLAMLGGGCAAPALPPTPIPSPTFSGPALNPAPATTTAAPTPMETAARPTALPTLPPPTPAPEPTIAPTPWPFEPPTGQIFFFYAPDPLDFEPHGELNEYNLYRADATGDPNEWQIITIFTQTVPSSILLSPDRTKLSVLLTYDTNGDGRLTTGAMPDLRDVFIYYLLQESIQQLTTTQVPENPINSIAWMPENDVILACHAHEIAKILIDTPLPEIILSASDFAFKGTFTLSPDKNLLIFPTTGSAIEEGVYEGNDRLQAFMIDTSAFTILQDDGVFLNMTRPAWSPNGNWLAYGNARGQTFILNANTLSFSPLLADEERTYPTGWSRDGRWLNVVKNSNSLLLWNPETQETTELLSSDEVKNPIWSPQTNQIAVSLIRDSAEELLLVDAETGNMQTLLSAVPDRHINPYSWSPDGNWLLLLIEEPKQSGLFVLHPASGALFPVMDTTGGLLGYSHVWIPGME